MHAGAHALAAGAAHRGPQRRPPYRHRARSGPILDALLCERRTRDARGRDMELTKLLGLHEVTHATTNRRQCVANARAP